MVWGTHTQTPASPGSSGLGTPGEPEGPVPSEPFRRWAGRMYKDLCNKHRLPAPWTGWGCVG